MIMCGIAGIIFKNGRPIDKGNLETMASFMQERGPDNTGYHIDQSLGFVHTRLSIIDLNHNELEFLEIKGLLDQNLIKPFYLS